MLCRCVIGYITRAILSSPLRCLRFSASSLTLNPSSNAFDDGVEVGSAVYRHALKFQRPGVIKWCKQLQNTASFIGSVTREPKVVAWKTAKFGVHTWLTVRSSDYSSFGWALLLIQYTIFVKLIKCLNLELPFWFTFIASSVLANVLSEIGLNWTGLNSFGTFASFSPVFSSADWSIHFAAFEILQLQVKTIVICISNDSVKCF